MFSLNSSKVLTNTLLKQQTQRHGDVLTWGILTLRRFDFRTCLVHFDRIPFSSIVSFIGTIAYACAKYLADVLSLILDKTEHRVKNSNEFAEYVKKLKLGPDEELRSYDVSPLFTSALVDEAMDVIGKKLEDENLSKRTPLSPRDIIILVAPKMYTLLV